jgi:hypothetical protein
MGCFMLLEVMVVLVHVSTLLISDPLKWRLAWEMLM